VFIDAVGGNDGPIMLASMEKSMPSSNRPRKQNPLLSLFMSVMGRRSRTDDARYGGLSSNAYVLQYVKRTQLPYLYKTH
jgi:hypothetical protein